MYKKLLVFALFTLSFGNNCIIFSADETSESTVVAPGGPGWKESSSSSSTSKTPSTETKELKEETKVATGSVTFINKYADGGNVKFKGIGDEFIGRGKELVLTFSNPMTIIEFPFKDPTLNSITIIGPNQRWPDGILSRDGILSPGKGITSRGIKPNFASIIVDSKNNNLGSSVSVVGKTVTMEKNNAGIKFIVS